MAQDQEECLDKLVGLGAMSQEDADGVWWQSWVAEARAAEAEVAEAAEVASPENVFRVAAVQPNQEAVQEHAVPLPIPLEPALSRAGDLHPRPPELAQHM